MIALSLAWFALKRMPRILVLIFNIVSIFLTIFLLVGCYNSSQQSTFLARYEFNKQSPMYNVVTTSFDSSDTTKGLQNIIIRSGYLGVCVDNIPANYDPEETICFSRKNISNVALYDELNIKVFNIRSSNNSSATNSTNLNILDLAHSTSVEVIHPYVLMATVILSILMFCLVVYVTIPKIPFKSKLNNLLLLLAPVLVLIWGIGAMWTHVGINASANFVPDASMNIIKVRKGKKAATMSWFAFSFLLLDCIILWILYFRDRKSLSEEIDKVKNNHYDGKYASDGSTLGYKV